MSLFRRKKPDLPTIITRPPEPCTRYEATEANGSNTWFVFPNSLTRKQKLEAVHSHIRRAYNIFDQIEDEPEDAEASDEPALGVISHGGGAA